MGATDTEGTSAPPQADAWYARSPEEVAAHFEVDPAAGLSAVAAAELLEHEIPCQRLEDCPEHPVL